MMSGLSTAWATGRRLEGRGVPSTRESPVPATAPAVCRSGGSRSFHVGCSLVGRCWEQSMRLDGTSRSKSSASAVSRLRLCQSPVTKGSLAAALDPLLVACRAFLAPKIATATVRRYR